MKRRIISTEQVKTDQVVSKKKTYESPKATYVPIKLEERLFSCNQPTGNCIYGWQN